MEYQGFLVAEVFRGLVDSCEEVDRVEGIVELYRGLSTLLA
jgi:hypothetical protein